MANINHPEYIKLKAEAAALTAKIDVFYEEVNRLKNLGNTGEKRWTQGYIGTINDLKSKAKVAIEERHFIQERMKNV